MSSRVKIVIILINACQFWRLKKGFWGQMGLDHSGVILFMAGIAFFIYGIHLASENLQSLSADRIRKIIQLLANKPFWGVFLGVILTMIFQSSGAVTSMLVGLGSARVINLQQVMSLILGTAIGSTLTVQILSFNISKFGLPIFATSFFVFFLTKRRTLSELMLAAMGFGLLFWGLELVRHSTQNLGQIDVFITFLKTIGDNPILAILVSGFFTALVHSSAVTLGIVMAMNGHGYISLDQSMYWIFGANIGTTATALIASVGSHSVGKQVAWAHCFYKVVGVILIYPFMNYLINWISTGEPERDVANLNTAYNCLAAVIFFPWINVGAKWIQSVIPLSADEKEFTAQFLQKKDWESPSIVVAHAEREILRMCDIVSSMVNDSVNLFSKNDADLIASIRRRDDQADLLSRELNLYLAQHLEQASQPLQLEMIRLMNYSADLEAAADVVDNQLLELATKTHLLKIVFPQEGLGDIEKMHLSVSKVTEMSIACFQVKDPSLAKQVIQLKRDIRKMEQEMREAHIGRMVKGSSESINSSTIHLDVLSEYRRVVGLMTNHAYPLAKSLDSLGQEKSIILDSNISESKKSKIIIL